ncbi:epimerase [Pseudoprimorskyibacter insulae]|uniref:Epimerase n=1 Tax=Pseudoprimorskyibacter insulae TaxID=1695997 RepID=A0A2R8AZ54_9RHOB|nr:epimerase [Pseudoprimorskyibacter insulae]SPF81119.1 hypothetical protein PRI8871_02937 [Pseudoprimorskyibacter insulae]
MTQTILILGGSGRLARNAAEAFWNAGWQIKFHDRKTGSLKDDAIGVDVILNSWHPSYDKWQEDVPTLTRRVIEAAKASGATVIVPGNVYSYGASMPQVLTEATPHRPSNILCQIRQDMEETFRASGVPIILIRAGDFLDTEQSGNWFDSVMIKLLPKALTYPGNPDIPHSWAFLPDVAQVMVQLANRRSELPRFAEFGFEGYTITGRELAAALGRVTGNVVKLRPFAWWQISLASPFWKMARYLKMMRYLWDTPHSIDGGALHSVLPLVDVTPLDQALSQALPQADHHPFMAEAVAAA